MSGLPLAAWHTKRQHSQDASGINTRVYLKKSINIARGNAWIPGSWDDLWGLLHTPQQRSELMQVPFRACQSALSSLFILSHLDSAAAARTREAWTRSPLAAEANRWTNSNERIVLLIFAFWKECVLQLTSEGVRTNSCFSRFLQLWLIITPI